LGGQNQPDLHIHKKYLQN